MKTFLTRNATYLFSLFVISFLLLFLSSNLLLGLIFFLFSFFLCSYLVFRIDKQRMKWEKDLASYSFFYALLQDLNIGIPLKQSIQVNSRYLIGYQEMHSYDECLNLEEKAFNLSEFSLFFGEIIKREKKNEALLPDYRPLSNAVSYQYDEIKRKLDSSKQKLSTFLLTITFCFVVILLLITNSIYLTELFSQLPHMYLYLLLLTSVSPLYLILLERKIKSDEINR